MVVSKITGLKSLFLQKYPVLEINSFQNNRLFPSNCPLLTKMLPSAEESPYNLDHSDQNYVSSCNLPLPIVHCYQSLRLVQKLHKMYCRKEPKKFGTPILAHANCTLFFTSTAAFVCKKKTRSFRVFPPENWKFKSGGISDVFYLGFQQNASSQRYEKNVFFGMFSARGLAHTIMQIVYFPMVLNKQYSMPDEALMS